MKTIFLSMILITFFTAEVISQKAIKILDAKTNKEIIIKEGKRIRVKTAKRKITGRFKVITKDTIAIRKMKIALDKIIKIKRSPLALILVNAVVLYVPAALGFVGAVLLSWWTANSSIVALSTISAIGVSFGYIFGTISINVLKGHLPSKTISISIIDFNNN